MSTLGLYFGVGYSCCFFSHFHPTRSEEHPYNFTRGQIRSLPLFLFILFRRWLKLLHLISNTAGGINQTKPKTNFVYEKD